MLHLDGKYLYELMMLEYLFFSSFVHWESLKPLITQWNHLLQIRTWTHVLGLEPTWLGTQTHITRTWTWLKSCLGLEPMWLELKPSQKPWYLVSGPNEAQIFDISSQKEFSEKNGRWEVDLFRFRETHTSQTEWGPLPRTKAVAS